MREKRGLGRSRRPGISNLIGAIFFVLIVALSVATLTVMFQGSSAYIGGIHTTNQQVEQQVQTNVSISGVSFGGELSESSFVGASGRPGLLLNDTVPQPLLPVTNMNFTTGMQGWYVSQSYPQLVDGATVSSSLDNAAQPTNDSSYIELTTLPAGNPETFQLTVTNNAAAGSHDLIAKISLLVDTDFTGVAGGVCTAPACVGWNAPIISTDEGGYANNITLTTPVIGGLEPGVTATWQWTADVPAVAGTYYHTVVVYWYKSGALTSTLEDYGIATVSNNVTSPLPSPNPAAPNVQITPEASLVNPGGLIAGYDSNAISCTSSSGPGCIYVNFEPNVAGQRLPSGDELSAGAAFTTTFSLSQAQICQLRVNSPPGCGQFCGGSCYMDASISSSLDEVASVPNSLVYYHLVLVNPTGTPYTINQGGSDPTTLNHFGASGWNEQNMRVQPSTAFWVPGTYRFELVVNMTMPSGLPSEISMHFDDIGLALNLIAPGCPGSCAGGSAYGSGDISFSFPGLVASGVSGYNEVEQLTLGLNMSLTSLPPQTLDNTAAYVYVEQVPVSILNQQAPSKWFEVGSVTFNGSATANVSIPVPNAASFVNIAGVMTVKVVAVSVGSGDICLVYPSQPYCELNLTGYAIAQTANSQEAVNQVVFTITNGEGAAATHLVSLSFSGPNGTLPANPLVGSTSGLATFPINNWVSAGTTIVIAENLANPPTVDFAWIPGQVYQVTVLSSTGTSYSSAFTAP